ncbi:hypothetical protein MT325_m771R [Paramecium bursaria chlorella virus MT325]|uniref:Uncharacterized protein m771R n=1 Tax=Paramecium bursaria Chlorella virus MT325 TaxID=346932 RepID=A7IVF1_PBCVM|nr:hypothetical protein MT325_m771R [Paramecium bursaria chlorella virus MT325]
MQPKTTRGPTLFARFQTHHGSLTNSISTPGTQSTLFSLCLHLVTLVSSLQSNTSPRKSLDVLDDVLPIIIHLFIRSIEHAAKFFMLHLWICYIRYFLGKKSAKMIAEIFVMSSNDCDINLWKFIHIRAGYKFSL